MIQWQTDISFETNGFTKKKDKVNIFMGDFHFMISFNGGGGKQYTIQQQQKRVKICKLVTQN